MREAQQRRELEQAQALARSEIRRAKILRFGLGILTVFLFIAIGAAWLAMRQTDRAEQQARIALARQLAAQGQAEFANNPLLGVRLALEGLALASPEDVNFRKELVKQTGELAQSGRLLKLGEDVEETHLSPDGSVFVLVRADAPSELRRTADGSLIVQLTAKVDSIYFDKSLYTRYFVIRYKDTYGELRRTVDGSIIATLKDEVYSASFSSDPNATYFAVYYFNSSSELRRTADGLVIPLTDQVHEVFLTLIQVQSPLW